MLTPAPFRFIATIAVRACQLGTATADTPRKSAQLAAELIRYHRRYVKAAVHRCNGYDDAAARLERLLSLEARRLFPQLDALKLRVAEYFSDPRAGSMIGMRAQDGSPALMSTARDPDGRPFLTLPL